MFNIPAFRDTPRVPSTDIARFQDCARLRNFPGPLSDVVVFSLDASKRGQQPIPIKVRQVSWHKGFRGHLGLLPVYFPVFTVKMLGKMGPT